MQCDGMANMRGCLKNDLTTRLHIPAYDFFMKIFKNNTTDMRRTSKKSHLRVV